jgi:integrase
LPDDKKGRTPDTYFCVISGDWQPRIIDDPNLPKQFLTAFAHRRDQLIARVLFESGARVSEVLGLRLGDWLGCEQRERALATNKGSRGEHVKEIWWSSTTSQLLRNYINYDRRLCDRRRRGLDDLLDSDPLFINDEGAPYTYAAFYFHWQKACEVVKIRITPHQARHWFVTMALHRFQSLPDEQREAARQALIAYMDWKNPETIKAYDHHIHTMDFASTHAALVELVKSGSEMSTAAQFSNSAARAQAGAIPQEMLERLSQLLDGDRG